MRKGRTKAHLLYLTPVMDWEINDYPGYAGLYLLYKDENGVIEVGVPDFMNNSVRNTKLANMDGASLSSEKFLFWNGCHTLRDNSLLYDDCPVYEVTINKERQVASCKVINEVGVSLDSVLAGKFISIKEKAKEKSYVKRR